MSMLPGFEDSPQPAKVCTECGLTKPLGDYYVKVKATGRLFARCKSCIVRRRCEWAKANREKVAAASRRYYHANAEGVLERKRARDKLNRPKQREAEQRYRAANPEKIAAKKKRYAERNRHVIRASAARYRERLGAEALRERHKAWREANPDRALGIVNAAKHRRRARIAGSGGSHTPAEWSALKTFYGHTCLMCGRVEPDIKLTKDHVVPIVSGGTDDIGNIQPLCKSCNCRKHRKTIDLRT